MPIKRHVSQLIERPLQSFAGLRKLIELTYRAAKRD